MRTSSCNKARLSCIASTHTPGDMNAISPGLFYVDASRSRNAGSSKLQFDALRLVTAPLPSKDQPVRELVSYISPDFKAVQYFQKEFLSLLEFHIIDEIEVAGFEIYLVDQWVRGRNIGTVVLAFTGNMNARVKAIKFTTVRNSLKLYPRRFQEYLNELMQNHATFKRIDAEGEQSGDLNQPQYSLVTNLTDLDPQLNLIPITCGDVRQIMDLYTINLNLKKLNCGGRSLALLSEKISDASEDKFRQMYKVFSADVPIEFAVKELVNIVQTCLFYYDLLDAKHCDGLLCLKTEDAINNWWNLIGLPHFNFKPNPRNGVLPSKTVAAIISLTLSVRMRLHEYGGCEVPKDPFEFENMMISIGQFQKQMKIEKRRKLDLATILSLYFHTGQRSGTDSTKQIQNGFGSSALFEDESNSSFTDLTSNLSKQQPFLTSAQALYNPHRRGKINYSKEFKKLTNVVKSTVQDHILVREDMDDFYGDSPSAKTTVRLRNKIASKLIDSTSPSDVETTDLEVLVRKHLVGKTLNRLWQPVEASTGADKKGEDLLSSASHHHHYRRQFQNQNHQKQLDSADAQRSSYKFVCFRDAMAATQEQNVVSGDRGSRLKMMKFALQGRRPNFGLKSSFWSESTPEQEKGSGDASGFPLFENSALKSTENSESCLGMCASEENQVDSMEVSGFRHLLTRRSTWPSALPTGCDCAQTANLESLSPSYLVRSASCSAITTSAEETGHLVCSERLRADFNKCFTELISQEQLRKASAEDEKNAFEKPFELLNYELVKLHNVYSHLERRRLSMLSEYPHELKGRMKDLTEHIDRMAFRSRDLLKKINEFDNNAQVFLFKLEGQCTEKLDNLIDETIGSFRFNRVFPDPLERADLIKQLTGREPHEILDQTEEISNWSVRYFVGFVYDFTEFILQALNFDRSKMNLDRIRRSYKPLDPNRKYIERVYSFFGRESSVLMRATGSRASLSTQLGI